MAYRTVAEVKEYGSVLSCRRVEPHFVSLVASAHFRSETLSALRRVWVAPLLGLFVKFRPRLNFVARNALLMRVASKASVVSLMISARHQREVLDGIVQLILVDVVNKLFSFQLSAERLFHYVAMFPHASSVWRSYYPVSLGGNGPTTVARALEFEYVPGLQLPPVMELAHSAVTRKGLPHALGDCAYGSPWNVELVS